MLVIGITGASGAPYAKRLLEELASRKLRFSVVSTEMGRKIFEIETGVTIDSLSNKLGFRHFDSGELDSPLASSGFPLSGVIIVPCSLKRLSSISMGYANDLLDRIAVNSLRTKRKLVLVIRETPIGEIEIENMLRASRAGAIIMPASPGFYHRPREVEDLVNFVVGKILELLNLEHELYERWRYDEY